MIVHRSFLKLLREKEIPLTHKFTYDIKGTVKKISLVEILDSYTSHFADDILVLVKMYEEWSAEDIINSFERLGFRECFNQIVGTKNGQKMTRICYELIREGEKSIKFYNEDDVLETWELTYTESKIKLVCRGKTILTNKVDEIMVEFIDIIDNIVGYGEPVNTIQNNYWANSK
ncbi:hypothetical protein [Neobacillus terrae]|uniref:hypothetical protein n=1 Tax=Neobacillus terrae TaxID=3034837 RepID=UPI001409FFF9|nr:hypothetical protein [Neobacillus terrae]NHM33641.1 hypothetical protein [Neobacillus terrae]